MSTAVAWEIGGAGALTLLVLLYLVLQLLAVRNEHLINTSVAAMRDALGAEPAPQRALLCAIADTLVAQDRAAARIEIAVHELALGEREPQDSLPEPQQLLKQLLDLPEPQRLLADFLAEHAGAAISGTTFLAIKADLLRAATAEVFADLTGEGSVTLDLLQELAADGGMEAVALAALKAPVLPGRAPFQAPRVAALDFSAMKAIVTALDSATRRQLRLLTLLHGQAEALLRVSRNQGRLKLRTRLDRALRLPLIRRPQFTRAELRELEIVFDAVGEVIDSAEKQLAAGQAAGAMQLLASLRLPVPAGLPGRMFHLDSLAQARPAAAVGVWHRLAVSRWLAAALTAVTTNEARTYWFGVPPDDPTEHDEREVELALWGA